MRRRGDRGARLAEDASVHVLKGHCRAESVSISQPQFREYVVHGADFYEADTHPLIAFRSRDRTGRQPKRDRHR